ncbi:unnamed protein product [Caenorhabditis angaria]|uniref:Uncharacterized protein n=1 Tax=Caenorhabditis angaria TaxID=860376 RepID=A0A9P1NCA4_9PELO|nr:unnamed protein product [Caenorhabditis angaria]
MSAKIFSTIFLLCFIVGMMSATSMLLSRNQIDDPEYNDNSIEEDKKICFCCRAFVCRHRICPCSRFTAL